MRWLLFGTLPTLLLNYQLKDVFKIAEENWKLLWREEKQSETYGNSSR